MKDQVFFLPIETRPKDLPPLLKMVGKFWHTGIIHKGKVFECFNFGRNSISDFNDRGKELVKQKAVIVDVSITDENKIYSEIGSGTDCSEYVARVVGLSSNAGNKKEYWPEQVYDFILNKVFNVDKIYMKKRRLRIEPPSHISASCKTWKESISPSCRSRSSRRS